jgi:hypothetical protein
MSSLKRRAGVSLFCSLVARFFIEEIFMDASFLYESIRYLETRASISILSLMESILVMP